MESVSYLFILKKPFESANSQTKATSPSNSMLAANSSSQDYFFSPMQAEKKKAGPGDDCHGNPEIDRLRKEVQDTKEINKKLRDLLQVHKNHMCSLSL